VRLWKGVLAHRGWIGLFLFSFLADTLPAGAQQAAGSAAESNSTTQSVAGRQRISLDGIPESPGALRSGLQKAAYPQARSETQSMPDARAESQTANPQAAHPSQSSLQSPQPPVGTAAAGALRGSGVAASQPAGLAMAPAKQRRVRTIVIRVSAMVGAGVAVGTVVALTRATPSKPPGPR
jgi:hypothetical protein